jgi:hypothetical protein
VSSPSWGTIPFGGQFNTAHQQAQQYALIGSHWDEDQRVFFTGIKESTVDDTYDVTFRAARACLWVTIHVQSEGTGGRDYDAATFESSTRYDMRQDRVREIEVTTDGAQSYYIWAIPEFEQTADGTFYKYDGVDADDHMAFTEIRPGLPATVLQGTLTSGSIPYATASDTLADTTFEYNGSGQMQAPNGGPFAPAYSFGDQNQMGMYRKGTDELGLYGGASGWTLYMDQAVVDLYWGGGFYSGVQDMIQMRDGVARPSLYMGVSGDFTNTTTSQIYVYGSGSSSNLVFRGGDNNAGATFVTNAVTGDKGYAAIYAEGSGAAGQSNYGAFYVYSVDDSEIDVTAAGASQGTIAGRLSANTGLRTVDGDASTPAWSFESDTDTGVFRPGANQWAVAVNGNSRFKVETDQATCQSMGLVVDDTFAVGQNRSTAVQSALGGTWTGGAVTAIAAYRINTDVVLSSSTTASACLFEIGGGRSVTTPGTSLTVQRIASMYLREPAVVVGAGDTVTDAATLYIQNAPTEATNNYALHVDDGGVRIDDGIPLGGGSTPTLGTIGGTGPATAAQNQWLRVYIGTGAFFIPVWQ